MSRSDVLLWILVFLAALFVIWLAITGRLQAVADLLVEGYWRFMQNIVKGIHR
jgi:hypothetical protein